MEKYYDIIVVGAGHAGCEAALSSARLNNKTLLLTLSLDAIAFLACNPSIGGTAKGQLVSEIDALGGEMGVNADKSTIQLRMLNKGKGIAVQSLRAQADKNLYHINMKQTLEETENLDIKQAEASEILTENNKVIGLKTKQGEKFLCKAIIVCSGVYLNSRIFVGDFNEDIGPNGFKPSNNFTQSLINLGLEIRRFKTGTPMRVHASSIDFSALELQEGENDIQMFSFLNEGKTPNNVRDCYLAYTNKNTHELIRNNLDKFPMYSGEIVGVGPRYCPSIETKIMRFSDKERHQLFIEPEALSTKEVYIQGFSTSAPVDLQEQMLHSLKGFENAKIMRDAYAIEYDCINSLQLTPTLEYKNLSGLYFAGQVNGTSGYEEAAAQGLLAGINASLKINNKEPLILKRSDAYIGVLIDDLVTKGTNEPYRMMTSRAEYRLVLRQDNADLRLTEIGRKVGLVNDERFKIYQNKKEQINSLIKDLNTLVKPEIINPYLISVGENEVTSSITYYNLIKRNNVTLNSLIEYFNIFNNYSLSVINEVNTTVKYEGYIKKQEEQIINSKKQEELLLSQNFDYNEIKALRLEAIQKLNEIKPLNIGQASRISGISPADINVLIVYFKANKIRK